MKTLLKNMTMFLTKDKEVQALVVGYDYVTKNLVAQVENKRALLAQDDISIYQNTKNTDDEIHKLIGSTINCTIVGKNRKDILLSRKQVMQKKIKEYEKGDIVEATVVSASNNALYLEFDEGLIGKMYVNEITSSKLERPLDIYNIGDKIKCIILKKQDDGKFLLSRLSLYKNEKLNVHLGQIVRCRITQKVKEDPGYFVEVVSNPDYSGIFDINQYNKNNIYNIGDEISLRVVDIKPNKKLKFRTNHSNTYVQSMQSQNSYALRQVL